MIPLPAYGASESAASSQENASSVLTGSGQSISPDISPDISQRVLSTLRQPLLILNAHLRVQFASHAFYAAFQTTPQQTLGKPVFALNSSSCSGSGSWASPDLIGMLNQVLLAHSSFHAFEVTCDFPALGHRTMLLSGFELDPELDSELAPELNAADDSLTETNPLILLIFEDITNQKAERIRLNTQRRSERAARAEGRAKQGQIVADALRVSRVADGLQRALLQPIPENAFPGLPVAAIHQGAAGGSIGGDFFDAFLLPNDSIALVVGDVEGHGLKAAMRIGEIKYSLRAFLRENMNPAETLCRLNDLVHASHRLDKQAEHLRTALSVALINPYTWEVTFARAGAEPPLILEKEGSWKSVEAKGTMLGVMEEAYFGIEKHHLKQGDTLLLYTDGLTEARIPFGYGFFGAERVAQQTHEALQINRLLAEDSPCRLPLKDVGQLVLEAALAHARGPLADDACLLLACRQ